MLESDFHLYENTEILDTLKKEFNGENNKKIFIIKPNYILSFKGNRTLKFIPSEYLSYSNTYKCGFFESIAHILFIGRKMINDCSRIYKREMHKKGLNYFKTISEFLDTDENTIIESFMMIFNSFERESNSNLSLLYYPIQLASSCFNCHIEEKFNIPKIEKCNIPKIENYTKLIKIILERIINKQEIILESNIMIINVDEREFLFNYFRKNDSSYCNFEHIKDFPNIHKFNENPLIDQNLQYFDIIRKLCIMECINLDDIYDKLKSIKI